MIILIALPFCPNGLSEWIVILSVNYLISIVTFVGYCWAKGMSHGGRSDCGPFSISP